MVDVELVVGTVVEGDVIMDISEEEEGVAWMSLSWTIKASLDGQ